MTWEIEIDLKLSLFWLDTHACLFPMKVCVWMNENAVVSYHMNTKINYNKLIHKRKLIKIIVIKKGVKNIRNIIDKMILN